MEKILIAIKQEFNRNLYKEIFQQENYNVLIVEDEEKLLNWIKIEEPNIIFIDIGFFSEESKYNEFIKENSQRKIPIIAFAQFGTDENKERAMELGAKDFVSPSQVSPAIVVRKIKILLGEQKSYLIDFDINKYDALNLIKDIKEGDSVNCPKCNEKMVLYLMKDLSKGDKYYKISIICPKCL